MFYYLVRNKSHHFIHISFVVCKSKGECNTILCAYKLYRHLKKYCIHQSKSFWVGEVFFRLVVGTHKKTYKMMKEMGTHPRNSAENFYIFKCVHTDGYFKLFKQVIIEDCQIYKMNCYLCCL